MFWGNKYEIPILYSFFAQFFCSKIEFLEISNEMVCVYSFVWSKANFIQK